MNNNSPAPLPHQHHHHQQPQQQGQAPYYNHRAASGSTSSTYRPHVNARELLNYFREHMDSRNISNSDEQKIPEAPERISLKGYCEAVEHLTPRSRRAVLNLGIDFIDEVVTVPNLHNLPPAARGLAEAEMKWLHHLGRRRFEVVEALENERDRLIEQQAEAREQRESFLKEFDHHQGQQQQNSSSSVMMKDSNNPKSPRSGGSSRASTPRVGGGKDQRSISRSNSNISGYNNVNRAHTPTLSSMDPAEYQQARAAKQEQAMMEAMKKKIAADDRMKQHEERSIALAQLTLKRQQQQERAAHKARERAEQIAEQKRREKSEQEHQKMVHRREVQQMRDHLEDAMRQQQEQQEAEKEMSVEERRHARMQRLRHQRRELEKKRLEQQERLVHLQRNIEFAEERKREEYEERMKTADVARNKQQARKEEVLAMHSEYQEHRGAIYRERKQQLEHAHAASITRYKEKDQAAIEKRDEILGARQQALKDRIFQHAQREIAARQMRGMLEKEEEDAAKQLEGRLKKQEKRSKTVLRHKSDEAKMRLAEKQLVFHDHKMHAMHIQRMHEVREQNLAKRVDQKMHRIEQLRDDAEELEQYRKSLRHMLEATKEHSSSQAGRSKSPVLGGGGSHQSSRARTPAPAITAAGHIYNQPGPASYDTVSADTKLQQHGQISHRFGTGHAQQATRMDDVARMPGPGSYQLPGAIRSNVGITIPPPKTPEPRLSSM